MFAFSLTTTAMRLLLPVPSTDNQKTNKNTGKALALLTFSGVIFRSELALLVATQTLFGLSTKRITLKTTIISGLIAALTALALTISLDGAFWQRFPLWPEFEAFLFNVMAGQSSAWGTEPWSWYFTNALPRLLLNPLVYTLAIPVALRQPATRSPALALLVPSLAFVALYSFMPHKEWRFIVYIIPSLTATAALGAGYLWTHRSRSFFMCWASRVLALSVLLTACLSNFVLLPASAVNYPGGRALDALHSYHASSNSELGMGRKGVNVYLGNLACQTGVTRFVQLPDASGWVYDKTEDEVVKSTGGFWERFDYVLLEAFGEAGHMDSDETRFREALPASLWEVVYVADSFAGISVLRPGFPATGTAEKRVINAVGGSRVVELFDSVRERVRGSLFRGWWVEIKMKPRVRVLKRVRGTYS
jgi:alpha-1,6-mannosyltransferase